ncbi:hypothetical protein [Acetobacterium bakii]|uniref:Uncharacterized protein n=1 Tax=Acetobacterium bakii TaxID=52689 RepID=A0A0L6U590_9FIRM|nr:hypothetical protein [Acetobacterium bakii]KNZ42950.1 hypothetical protein AKG39_04320 [Acetobacterium bakii]
MEKIKILGVLLAGLLLVGGCVPGNPEPRIPEKYETSANKPLSVITPASPAVLQCHSFISEELTSPLGGVYTNLLISDDISELSTGHEILSESMGLLLEYARLTDDDSLFNATTDYILNHFIDNDILLWRIVENGSPITDVSATIDDLRIYQTLYLKKSQGPLNESGKLLLETLETQLSSRGFHANYLVDYYGNANPTTVTTVETAYINLESLASLAQEIPELREAFKTNEKILLGSFISEELPLYHKTYNIKNASYEDLDNSINILDSLMVMLNLAQAGMYSTASIEWLEEKTVSGTLYSYYDPDSGEALDTQTSSAAYGLAAQIGAALGNEFLTDNALNQLKKHQNTDQQSKLYGGFGYDDNAYSYDNLQALLGLLYNKSD